MSAASDLSGRHTPPPAPAAHRCFTASSTAYLRNLAHEDRRADAWAVHYQRPPQRDASGRATSFSLNFPLLLVTAYAEGAEAIARRVAEILNQHWDEA